MFRLTRRARAITVALTITAIAGGLVAINPLPSTSAVQERVLVLSSSVRGGSSSIEAIKAANLGFAVDIVSNAQWASMTTNDFAAYRAIILGDPDTSSISAISAAVANANVWGPAVDGRVAIFAGDPAGHASQGGRKFLEQAVTYVTSSASGRTGLFVTLSQYYDGASPGTPVPLLDAVGGGFTVRGAGCSDSIQIVAQSDLLTGITEGDLSGWGCSVHEAFDTWNDDFGVVAIDSDLGSSYHDPNGNIGSPYILTRGGGRKIGKSEGRGGRNGSEPHLKDCKKGQPVNCRTGNFWHTFTDFSIPGRGPALHLERTYNSDAAAENGPFGYGWATSYTMHVTTDTDGSRTITQENGATVTFNPGPNGTWTAPPRVFASLTTTTGGYLFERMSRERFTFDTNGRLTSIADLNGETTALAYDTNGLLATVTDPAGRALTFTHDTSGRVVSVTDPLSRTVTYDYSTAGELTSATDAADHTTAFTYDSAHRMLTMTRPRGGIVTNTYDTDGRVIQQENEIDGVFQFAYDEFATTVTDPAGHVIRMEFSDDKLVALTKGVDTPEEATTTYTYNPDTFARLSRTDANNHTTTWTYDTAGNPATETDSLNHTTTFTYGPHRELTSTTDPDGLTTTITHDGAANPLTVTRPVGTQTQTVTLVHGDLSHPADITAVIDANGKTWIYIYDTAGNLTSSTDPLGNKTTYTYDAAGRPTTSISPRGNKTGANPVAFTTTYTHTALNQLAETIDPLGHHSTWTYDDDGNLATTTDAANHATSYDYDLAGRLTDVTRPDNSTYGTGYDANGNITSQTDPLGNVTQYSYDSLDRVTTSTDPLLRSTSYGYDDAGNLTTLTDPSGDITTYSYDDADQLAGITYSDGTTPNVTYTRNNRGQITTETDTSGFTRTYSYDTLGRLTNTTDTRTIADATTQQSVTYTYDLANRITGLTPCSYATICRTISRGYDNAGRMTSVNDGLGHTTRFTYNADGNLTLTAYGNNTNAVYNYDNAGQLTNTIAATAAGQLTFPSPRNNLGFITSDNTTGTPAGPTLFLDYDNLNRLDSAGSSSAGAADYDYDAADRLTQWVTTGNVKTFTYDHADQLTSQTVRPGAGAAYTINYSYDPQGNRTSQAVDPTDAANAVASVDYAYDQANRLTGISLTNASRTNPVVQRYSYDSNGLRTDLNWDLTGGLPLIVNDETGNTYVNGPDGLPVEQITPAGTTLYYFHDQLGSTRALTNQAGTLTATYSYDPYGNPAVSANSPENPFQYAGQYTDPITGLIYMRARWYDPASARFLTRDPIEAITREAYGYVNGNPLNYVDPMGLSSCGQFSLGGLVDCASKTDDAARALTGFIVDHADDIAVVAGHVESIAFTVAALCGPAAPCAGIATTVAGIAGGTELLASVIVTVDACKGSGLTSKRCAEEAAKTSISWATSNLQKTVGDKGKAALSNFDNAADKLFDALGEC